MNDQMTKAQESGFEQRYDLDAPPEKVWRAISIAEFRENGCRRTCSPIRNRFP
ncbi:Hypothetical protein NGAL_HAMBI2427_59410 [Neorhizobium galegae bv. orientalis]|nr:Hypothetical protein NGAL_HAMBI2427_59410 [Neorhizobium galegae bv. orientalis]